LIHYKSFCQVNATTVTAVSSWNWHFGNRVAIRPSRWWNIICWTKTA